MRKISSLAASLLLAVVALAACGADPGADSDVAETTSAPEPEVTSQVGSDGADKLANSSNKGSDEPVEATQLETPTVEIVDFGFGQGEYSGLGIVIVTSDDESAVGEYITTSVNFLNADGQIIATEEQTESLSWAGQELVLPVMFFDGKDDQPIASIEPFTTITDYGMGSESRPALPILQTSEIADSGYGNMEASFGFTNDTSENLENLRVGIVCYDAEGNIVGGGYDFPPLAGAGATIRIDASVEVSEKPATCAAHVNYGD